MLEIMAVEVEGESIDLYDVDGEASGPLPRFRAGVRESEVFVGIA